MDVISSRMEGSGGKREYGKARERFDNDGRMRRGKEGRTGGGWRMFTQSDHPGSFLRH